MSITWENLLASDEKQNLIEFPRAESSAIEYAKRRIELRNANIDINNYISKTILGDTEIAITANSFPYNVGQNIKHLVIWMRPKSQLSYKDAKAYISKILQKPLKKIIVFENLSYVKSVPHVPHYQVFVKD